ncbi:MAG: hypothetical protein RIC30_14235 [Marinoscillum sp.]|uniref:hypothetical protein n=1 Tax=Marinoscillum sp. TaxID=2024838 RepID=UPI0032F7AA7D
MKPDRYDQEVKVYTLLMVMSGIFIYSSLLVLVHIPLLCPTLRRAQSDKAFPGGMERNISDINFVKNSLMA